MKHDSALAKYITQPLSELTGATLLSVVYRVLECDLPGFDLGDPNGSGIMAVCLGFERESVWASWQSAPPNELQIAYVLRLFGKDEISFQTGIPSVNATAETPWSTCVGSKLESFRAFGSLDLPLAVRLDFPRKQVVLALGYPGSPPSLSDGDEVLVLSEEEFLQRSAQSRIRYEPVS